MSDYEETEVQQIPINWKFSLYDIVGVGFSTIGGVFNALAQGSGMMAREMIAAAAWSRDTYDAEQARAEWEEQQEYEEAARAQMAETYEALVGMDTLWLDAEESEEEDES